MNKKYIIFSIATIVCISLIGIVLVNTVFSHVGRQLELGQKYLDEGSWEQAIVAFGDAINIDPKNEDAYIKKAEAYLNLNDTENAIVTLIDGYRVTSGRKIKKQIEKISEKLDVVINLENIDKAVTDDANTNDSSKHDNSGNSDLNNKEKTEDTVYGPIDNKVLRDENITRAYSNYINGFISDEQVEALCNFWIPILEEERKAGTSDKSSWGSSLSKLYYMSGKFDACLEIRREANILTESGRRIDTNEGYWISDEYGNAVKDYISGYSDAEGNGVSEKTMSYRNDGKYSSISICNNFSEPIQRVKEITYVYEYDELGRLVSRTDTAIMSGEVTSTTNYTYTYEGDMVYLELRLDYMMSPGEWASYDSSSTMTMDEYGVTYGGGKDAVLY